MGWAGLGWAGAGAGLGWAGLGWGWLAYRVLTWVVPKPSASFGRGPPAVGPQPMKR